MQGTNTPQHSTGEVAGSAGSVPGDLRPEHPPQTTVTALAELIGARVQWVAGTAATAPAAGDAPVSVTGVELRAQSIEPGDLFAALPGARAHGAEFAASALERGAVAGAGAPGSEIGPR